MRGRAFLLLLGAVSGCGLVSGLDGLDIADGSVPDVTGSTDASDAGPTLDAISGDVVGQQDGPVLVDASDAAATPDGAIRCGPTICSGGMRCCVTGTTSYTYSCANDCGGSASAALACDDKSDCSSTQICCYTNNVALCVANTTTCANTLCSSPSQCGNNAKCQAFSAGFGLALQRCQ